MMLDIGCGEYQRGDINLDLKIPQNPINFIKGDARCLPFKEGVFDTSFSSHVIEHLDNAYLFLLEVIYVTKYSGEAIIICPHRFGWGAKRPDHKIHLNKKWFMKFLNMLSKVHYQILPRGWRYSKPFPFLVLPNELEVKIKP